eukprot:1154634-Pelagomonas_calceolata.AAC.1
MEMLNVQGCQHPCNKGRVHSCCWLELRVHRLSSSSCCCYAALGLAEQCWLGCSTQRMSGADTAFEPASPG